MFVTLLAVVISAQPAPAEEIQYRSYDVATALKRGCKVQRVNVAAGKAEHAPIIRCPAQQTTTSGTERRPRS
ncbi:hypothetical protein [Sphingomonas psychrotolerans]|uniref:Uncharacterized protein n=1 Tax=Sphingomonas psychrotolerans TaxID=1327635 RepID=A0A2K8MAS7_9SPHN|nr:hypothetical protein [Sphingomonas psychrotolerans]ATY30985.1 hypothetical protein CVN68_02445 [Sphingomonas psychrotolerans]